MRSKVQGSRFKGPAPDGEEGYLLLGAIIAVALVMIALSVAAVKVSFELRREREEESARRADQYVRAVRRYYLKFGRYPGSVEQLENTNNIRFLRQKYVDPLTGKPDYRLIVVGQNKTTPKGFFGQPLSGLPGAGPGAAGQGGTPTAGAAPNGAPAAAANGFGAGSTATMGFGSGSENANDPSAGVQPSGVGTLSAQGAASGAAASSATGTSTSASSTTGSGPPGSNLGPIMGVGSSATGPSIITVNEQTSYETWEFLYDPRLERLRQLGQLNSGVSSAGGNTNPAGLGGAPQNGQPGASATPGAGSTPNSPTVGVPVQP